MTYTEGWKTERYIGSVGVDGCPMVAKSEAERRERVLRKALERIAERGEARDKRTRSAPGQDVVIARAALDREGGDGDFLPDPWDPWDREGEK
jgi:hypothetical protein